MLTEIFICIVGGSAITGDDYVWRVSDSWSVFKI